MGRLISLFVVVFGILLSASNAFASNDIEDVNLIFKQVTAHAIEEGIQIQWVIDYEAYQELKDLDYQIVIQYNTKIGAQRFEAGYSGSDWVSVPTMGIEKTFYEIGNLKGGENYLFQLGLVKEKQVLWTDPYSGKTKRGWGIFRFLVLVGSLGLFIYGMKIMSEGIQKAAGNRLRNLLGSLTSNTFKGVMTGIGVTALIQSSSVTTIMTVSFVNAGVLTLLQSAGVIMGANIGTTITGWIINIFGFELDLSSYVLILIAIGVPFMFVNKTKIKSLANAVVGFSLFFLGLEFLKGAVPTLGPDSGLIQFFIEFKDIPFLSTILFVLLGTLVTVIIQASAAAMALTMTLVAGGILPFEVATAMILGENVGTTITAQLAATVANVHAKRAAWIHTLFNLIGVIWMILLFPWFLQGIKWFMLEVNAGDPFTNPQEYANTGLVIFHTAFNIINVCVLIWFAPSLVRLAEKVVKSRGEADEEFHLDFIRTGYMSSPDLSLLEVKKELAKFGERTSRMSLFARSQLLEKTKKKQRKIAERIAKYEEITDRVEVEIANYLNKLSEGGLSIETARRVRGMNSIANNLERIGDIFYQISKALERRTEDKIIFSKHQRQSLTQMFDLVDVAFKIMIENLNKNSADVNLDAAVEAEQQINDKRNELKAQHLRDMAESLDFNTESGIIYNTIFSSLERIGDHIINVSEGAVGKI